MFFSMLFWAFFEQGGSSMNNFTDRNVDRVQEDRRVTSDDVGQTLQFEVNHGSPQTEASAPHHPMSLFGPLEPGLHFDP